jgi:hypothetical protein
MEGLRCIRDNRLVDPYYSVDGTRLDVDETFITLSQRRR